MHFIQGFQPNFEIYLQVDKLPNSNGDGIYNYQPIQFLQWICTVLKATSS